MRQTRYIDYDCSRCGSLRTRFVYFDTETGLPDDEPQVCDLNLLDDTQVCGGELVPREMSGIGYMQPINKNNSDFVDRERERLEKRQDDHWRRQGRDEAIDRERAFLKKQGAHGGVR